MACLRSAVYTILTFSTHLCLTPLNPALKKMKEKNEEKVTTTVSASSTEKSAEQLGV